MYWVCYVVGAVGGWVDVVEYLSCGKGGEITWFQVVMEQKPIPTEDGLPVKICGSCDAIG